MTSRFKKTTVKFRNNKLTLKTHQRFKSERYKLKKLRLL